MKDSLENLFPMSRRANIPFDKLFDPHAIAIVGISKAPYGGAFFLRSVEFTDTCETLDLTVPPLSKASQEKILQFIPDVNTNTRNPLDLGAAGYIADTFGRVIKILADEPQISSIIFVRDPERFDHYARVFQIPSGADFEKIFVENVAQGRPPGKSVAFVPAIAVDGEMTRATVARFVQTLRQKQIMAFDTIEAAAKCIYRLWKYGDYLRRRKAWEGQQEDKKT
jgi:acyl-CoA synthetase (NDP forming)